MNLSIEFSEEIAEKGKALQTTRSYSSPPTAALEDCIRFDFKMFSISKEDFSECCFGELKGEA